MKEQTKRRGVKVNAFLQALALFSLTSNETMPINLNLSGGLIGSGGPIYFPQRKKLKGYQKDHKGNKVR